MAQDAAPQPPTMGERGINLGQGGPLTIHRALSLGHTPDDPDVTILTLTVDGPATEDSIVAHVDVEADGPMVQVIFAVDLSALDVLDAAVREAYAAHRRHHDQQRLVTA